MIACYTGYYAALPSTTAAQAAAASFAGGFAAGAIQSGNLRGAVVGGISSLAFYGVGQKFSVKGMSITTSEGMAAYAKLALVSGVTGGVMAELQGGRFGNGFVSAGASAVLSPIPEVAAEGAAGQTVIAAVIGGTVSELSGGKFANGAITAAFQFAVGRGLARNTKSRLRSVESASIRDGGLGDWLNGKRIEYLFPELKDPGLISEFRDAWNDSLPADPIRRHEEGGFWGVEADGSYGVRRFPPGTVDFLGRPPVLGSDQMFRGLRVMGHFHTHPSPRPIDEFGVRRGSSPSGEDILVINQMRYSGRSYVIDNMNVNYYSTGNPGSIVGSHPEILGN